ncbi:MAG: radical SAM protein, partial [Candidatus Woesearchaeota archaeon]|nr:radical SAM protein [Candidatus Woesearchaeota archaeon]
LDDFEYIIKRFKVGHIYINDDNFFVNLRRARDIAQGILDRKLDISWDVLGAHAQTTVRMDNDYIKFLDKSRLKGLLIGAESGSPRILELIKKNITVQMLIDSNKKFIGTGIVPTYTFVSGYPTETKEDLQMSVNLLFRLWKDNPNIVPGNVKPFIPYPGTPLYDMAVKYGFKSPESVEGWANITWDNYLTIKTPWLSKEDKNTRVNLYYATILMNPEYMFIKNKIFKVATTLLSPWMKYRVKKLNFTLPVEIIAARLIHHSLL